MWNCSQHLLDPFQVDKLPQRSIFRGLFFPHLGTNYPRGHFSEVIFPRSFFSRGQVFCKKRVDPLVNSIHDIQATDGTRTRIWRRHKPLHGHFCHSRSIPGAT